MSEKEEVELLKNEADNGSKTAFVRLGILALRKEPYKGIHAVYSGFNDAFKARFGESSESTVNALADEGVVTVIPCKGGVRLYLAADAPQRGATAADTLAAMGLTVPAKS